MPARDTGEQVVPGLWPDLEKPGKVVGGASLDSALIVAVSKYHDGWTEVSGATENGQAWQRYLMEDLGVPTVKLLVGRDATKEAITRNLTAAAKMAKMGGRVWFVFIGHGMQALNGDSVLLGVDVPMTAEGLEHRGVRQPEMIKVMEESDAQPVMVVDACFSGFDRTGERINMGLLSTRMVKPAKVTKAVVLAATSQKEYAGLLPGARVPAFSYLVLGALRGWGDADGDRLVTAGEAVAYANKVMLATVNGREQTAELAGAGEVALATSEAELGPDIGAIVRSLAKDAERLRMITPDPEPPQEGQKQWKGLALGGGVGLGASATMATLIGIGAARSKSLERQYNESCAFSDGTSPDCLELDRKGRASDHLQIAGMIMTPLFLGVGAALLVIAMKRKSAGRQALAPLFGPRTAGIVWGLSF